MATTPPNPFDPQEVQKYLDRKDAAEGTKSRRGEELADEDSSPAVGTKSRRGEELADEDSSPAVGTGYASVVMGRADLLGADTPSDEAVEMYNYWKAQSPEVCAEAVTALLGALMSEAAVLDDAPTNERLSLDTALTAARLGKSIKDAGEKLYSAGRATLWEKVQHQNGKHTTASGETFRFKAGLRTSKRVDHKRFKTKYPEIYAEVVKITEKPSDAPGALYL